MFGSRAFARVVHLECLSLRVKRPWLSFPPSRLRWPAFFAFRFFQSVQNGTFWKFSAFASISLNRQKAAERGVIRLAFLIVLDALRRRQAWRLSESQERSKYDPRGG